MAETFKIYKKDGTKVVEGASPLTIKGIAADTQVAKGDYKAVHVVDDIESAKVDIPAFKTTAAQAPASEPVTESTAETETQPKAFDPEGDTKPTDSNTVDEIKAWLTAHAIDFTGKTIKADLLALVPTE